MIIALRRLRPERGLWPRIILVHPIVGSSSSSDIGGRKSSGGSAILVIVIAVVLIVLAWALSQLVKLALSRSREYLADAGSVELTKNPDAMISALRKIEGRGELPGATSAVMELCVDNPREGFADLFAIHPSARVRVGEIRRRPLALPMPPSEAQENETDPSASGQLPQPLPSGPWDSPGRAPDASAPFPRALGQPRGHPSRPWSRR